MTDLDKLIAAVEAGLPSPTNWRNFTALTGEDVDETPFAILAHRSYHGDLIAALRLHEALLPGWAWDIGHGAEEPFYANVYLGRKEHAASGYNPARAWLLAILRALKAKGNAT